MRILKTDKEIEKSLKKNEVTEINDYKRLTKATQETFDVKKKYEELQADLKVGELEQKRKILDAENQTTQFKIDNLKQKTTQALHSRKCDFVDTMNEIAKKEISELKTDGKKQDNLSTKFAVFSAFTTCAGIIDLNNLPSWIFRCICIIFGAIGVNTIIKNFNTYRIKFLEKKDNYNKYVYYSMICLILAYTTYSVITNYSFWTMTGFDVIGAGILAILFDGLSIIFAFISKDFMYLQYNNEYIKTVNDISEENPKENIKKNYQSVEESAIDNSNADTQIAAEEAAEQEPKKETKIKPKVTKSSVTRKGAGKINKTVFNKIIDSLEDGTVITPGTVGMTGNSSYYNWIEENPNITKDKDGKNIKISEKAEVI